MPQTRLFLSPDTYEPLQALWTGSIFFPVEIVTVHSGLDPLDSA